jgi:hypothetical protein
MKQTQEKFEDTKRIIICRKSKDRQYNGQKKKGQTNTSIPEIYKYSNTNIPEIYKYSNTSIPEIYKNLFRFLISCLNKMYLLLLLEKIKKKLLL